MLDKKTFAIGVLCLSAVILFVANILAPHPAVANTTIKDNDYQLQTGRVQGGGEALYVTDNRNGIMAVFVYSPVRRRLETADVRPIMTAFGNAGHR
jgi:hypothetical protein